MHELSIVQSLVTLVEEKSQGQPVTEVVVRYGPMRGIEPTAMQWAWTETVRNSPLANAKLVLNATPWTLVCPDCKRQWQTDDFEETCTCSSNRAYPAGGNELLLESLEVLEVDNTTAPV